ncbi:ABC transporter substrate-binding protein [Aquimarina sp. ERC-38]|uniref:ABC transporter substrate-binding protein n=1 Tax=Aquimarina sp. ERC-38 TaxID=2949996 RepID=UPI0022475469|nr:ABC transporter substrate-binding protein [Aquimarina sp. ERC-38]UZO81347.1 ABC transporter substrate-binding protein [Aquimarina sp. ERC-38]
MQQITLALDWTPNTNHLGFFIAKEKEFYKEKGIDLNIIDPSKDNYQETPAKKVELGKADLALCPLESIISYQTKSKPFDLIAIAALLQEDLSAIVTRNDGSIATPKDLDGKIYASYKARYEDEIVKCMIKNDGGEGNLDLTYPEKLGIWDTILNGAYDATWIFMNWEAQQEGISNKNLNYFKMKDYGIPYSYSPVIAVSQKKLLEQGDTYRNFLSATKKGYIYAKENQTEALAILTKVVPKKDHLINLEKSLEATIPYFGTQDWGHMDSQNVTDFLNWLAEHQLEKQELKPDQLFTNNYLEK